MTLELGGSNDDVAIAWRGRLYTYGELSASIAAWPIKNMHDASTLDLPDAVACVFAAARQGSAVAVENPEARPARHGKLEAWLHVGTSGSTGNPKPLTRTAASWVDSFAEFSKVTGLTRDDIVLITGPLHATMHLFAAVHALWLGACITDESSVATAVHAVPAVLRTLTDKAAPLLRTAVVAGIALDVQAREMAVSRGIRVVEYYGAAELSLVAVRVVPESLRIFAGVDAEVREGVLWVRSPFRAVEVEEWSSVGDLASIGPEGELTVRGRADAAINVGGTTVIAEDVEAALLSVPGVVGVAVVGAPHAVLGETVVAVIELGARSLDSIRADARKVLAREAMPRRWSVTESLPRTSGGKIDRARVRAELS